MDQFNRELWGPLAFYVGVWEGDKGQDIAPSDERGTETNMYRERMVFELSGPHQNHEQRLCGLRYSTTVTRLTETAPFHEDHGYWLWDAAQTQLMKCFVIPRGISLIAGGNVEGSARSFTLRAELGSPTYGVVQNQFLAREFQIIGFELTHTILDADTFRYEQNTLIRMKGRDQLFNHRDGNTLKRLKA